MIMDYAYVPTALTTLTQDPNALRLFFAIWYTGLYHFDIVKQEHSNLFEATATNWMTHKSFEGVSDTPQGAIAILAKKLNIE